MSKPSVALLVVGALVATIAVTATGATTQRSGVAADPVANEVRELRLAMERAAAVSTRVMLAAQQANAAQARIAAINWELADVRSRGSIASAEFTRYNTIVTEFERSFPAAVQDPELGLRLPQYQQYLQAKSQLDAQRQLEQDLRARVTELTNAMGREQADWNQLTKRLEALERSLGESRR